jgi:Rieske Fe-S protein
MVERDEPLDVPAPRRMSRRAFAKGCLYATAAAAVGGGAAATFLPLALTDKTPPKRIDYIGATLVSGPAPQGIPLLPLAKGPDGEVRGNASPPGVPGGVLDWYRYCAHEKTVGLQRGFAPKDEALRYFLTPEKEESIGALREQNPARGDIGWFLGKLGQVVRVADFQDVGYGAGVNWRSEGQSGKNIISAIVVRVDTSQLTFKNAKEDVVRNGFIVDTGNDTGLLAYVTFCKHFCCVPGWHESPLALKQGFFDKMFCTCHFSVYDPLQIKGDFFQLHAEAGPEEAAA